MILYFEMKNTSDYVTFKTMRHFWLVFRKILQQSVLYLLDIKRLPIAFSQPVPISSRDASWHNSDTLTLTYPEVPIEIDQNI